LADFQNGDGDRLRTMVRHQARKETELSRQRLAQKIVNIEGWTHIDEAWALHEVVRRFPGSEAVTVVEIGAWKGRSTIALALGVQDRGAGRVFSIDPHTGNRESIEIYGRVDTFESFVENIRGAGLSEFVEPIRSPSHVARSQFEEQSVNVLFVDGSHEYADVCEDIEDWTPTLSHPAIVAFNDPLIPGVDRALRELILKRNSPFRNACYVANTLFFEFHMDGPWKVRDTFSLHWLRMLLTLRARAQGPATRVPTWALWWGRRIYERLVV
jgi:hypothetical protein